MYLFINFLNVISDVISARTGKCNITCVMYEREFATGCYGINGLNAEIKDFAVS